MLSAEIIRELREGNAKADKNLFNEFPFLMFIVQYAVYH